jgi:hypothetical protein
MHHPVHDNPFETTFFETMKRIPFTAAALLWLCITSSAATYFASPQGGGDGLSIGSPTTFASGLKLLQSPGDTLYLLSGQYDLGNTVVQNLSGSTSQRIVISGYEGSNRSGKYPAILDFRQTAYGTRGLQIKSTCMYLHVKNLTLRYSGKNNLYNEGSYNLFENTLIGSVIYNMLDIESYIEFKNKQDATVKKAISQFE